MTLQRIIILSSTLLFNTLALGGMPPDFVAEYSLQKFGLDSAKASISLKKNQDGSWLYHSQTETQGLVSIFRKDKISEHTLLKEINGQIVPVSYEYRHTGGKKNRDQTIQFDWQKQQADSMVSGEASTIAITTGVVDNFSLQLDLMNDLQAGKKPLLYHVLNKGEIKPYEFKILGHEVIETDAGEYKTVKLIRSRKDSKRRTLMWAAPALHYLPVQITHIETDDSHFTLLLESIKGDIRKNNSQASTGAE